MNKTHQSVFNAIDGAYNKMTLINKCNDFLNMFDLRLYFVF